MFAKMDQVFGKENKTLKKILENWRKILEESGKSQGILSVRKSGNPAFWQVTQYPNLTLKVTTTPQNKTRTALPPSLKLPYVTF